MHLIAEEERGGESGCRTPDTWRVGCPKVQCGKEGVKHGRNTKVRERSLFSPSTGCEEGGGGKAWPAGWYSVEHCVPFRNVSFPSFRWCLFVLCVFQKIERRRVLSFLKDLGRED